MKNLLQNQKYKLNNNSKTLNNINNNETASPGFKMIDSPTMSKISITSLRLFDSSDNDSNYSLERSLPKIKSTINNYTKLADMKKLNKIKIDYNNNDSNGKIEKQLTNLYNKVGGASRDVTSLNLKSVLPSIPQSTFETKPQFKKNDVLTSVRLSSIVDRVNELKSKADKNKKQPLIEFLNNFRKENIKFNEKKKRLNLNLIHLTSNLSNKSSSNHNNQSSDSNNKNGDKPAILAKNKVKDNFNLENQEMNHKNDQNVANFLLLDKNINDELSESSETIRLLAPNPSMNTSLRDLNDFDTYTLKSSESDIGTSDDMGLNEFDFNQDKNEIIKINSNKNEHLDEFETYYELVKHRKLNLIDENSIKYKI